MSSDDLRQWFESQAEGITKNEDWSSDEKVRGKLSDLFYNASGSEKKHLSSSFLNGNDGQTLIQRYSDEGQAYVKAQAQIKKVEEAKSLRQLRGVSTKDLSEEQQVDVYSRMAEQRAELTSEKVSQELEYVKAKAANGERISASTLRNAVGQSYLSTEEARDILMREGLL